MINEDLTNVMGSFIETELNAFEEIHKEIERLNNIIKEVREYCDYGIKYWLTDDGFVDEVLKDVKEILDKENSK